jgi:hypothetical protein
MKTLESRKTVNWADTQTKALKGQRLGNTKRAAAISPALDKAADTKAESTEADPSETSTIRNLKAATVATAEGRMMNTAEDSQTPGTVDAEVTVTTTADVATTVEETDAIVVAMTIVGEIIAVEATGEAATAMMTDDVATTVNRSGILMGTQELTRASKDREAILNMAPTPGTTGVTTTAMMRGEAATMEDSLSMIHMATLEPTLDSNQGHREAIRNRATVDEMNIRVVTRSKAAVVLTTTDRLARSILDLLATMTDLSSRDMMTDHRVRDTKEATPALQATTTDLSSNLTSSTSKERVKWRTALSIPSVLATWTKALESLIFAGKATPRMRSTPSFPRSCTFTASCSSSTIVLSSAVRPT